MSKRVPKTKLCNLQNLGNLRELYTAFKEKHPNKNIVFSKFCALTPNYCVLAGSEINHFVSIYSAHQNVVLLVDALDWDFRYKDLVKLTLSHLKYFH